MPEIRLKDNSPLTSPVDADLIFTGNSALGFKESKTTFLQAKGYFGGTTATHSIYVSTTGNDANSGTITSPVRTIKHAQTLVGTTFANTQWNIVIDPGFYSETNLTILPFVNWYSNGKVLINDTSGSIILDNTAWNALVGNGEFNADGIQINGATTLSLIYTNSFSANIVINLKNFITISGPFLQTTTASGPGLTINLLDNVNFDTSASGTTVIDGVTLNGYGSHSIGVGSGVTINATHSTAYLFSFGNTGIDGITISDTTNGINLNFLAGAQIFFSAIDATGVGGANLGFDSTTRPLDFYALSNIINPGNISFDDRSFDTYNVADTLIDGANVAWPIELVSNARWNIGTTGNKLSNPISSNISFTGGLFRLTLKQPSGGNCTPAFDTNYSFPTGQPPTNLAANAYTNYLFFSPDGTQMVCIAPSGAAAQSLNIQQFLASGTYTPSAGVVFAKAKIWGAGGGGGGANMGSTGQGVAASGGGGGGYIEVVLNTAQLTSAITVTVGTGGPGGANTGANGTDGNDSSIAVSGNGFKATGGSGGTGLASGSSSAGGVNGNAGGNGQQLGTGLGTLLFTSNGQSSAYGFWFASGSAAFGGQGGGSFGGGAQVAAITTFAATSAGTDAISYGCGGGGACGTNIASGAGGGNGQQGLVIIEEYLS